MQNEVKYVVAADNFRKDAIELFAPFSGSPTKVLKLENSIRSLSASAPQREMVMQAARAAENQVYRGSIVLAWAAVIDAVQNYIFNSDSNRNAFFSCNGRNEISLEIYRERFGERDSLDVAKKAGLINKQTHKELVAMLDERNACAHPSDRWPTINEATGFIDKTVRHINAFNP